MLTQNQFEELLTLEHEIPGVEFKGPGPRGDDYLRAKVARAVMGMTNRRDGGVVIIGMEERDGALNPVGLSQNDANSWRSNDHVSTALANYMSPPASFHLSVREFRGREFAILEVHEFTYIPTICKKRYHRDHPSGHQEVMLREGACYIRSRHKPETVEVSSLEHLRELLDLAIEKGVRKFVTQAQKAGMSLSSGNQHNDQELFEQQIENWTSPLIEKIQSRGFWKVIIRPTKFIKERILDFTMLYPLIQKTSVNLRGFSFPYTGGDMKYQSGNDWVGEEFEWDWVHEAWRFFQSGQFVHISGLLEDWHDVSKWNSAPEGWVPGRTLSVEGVVYRCTEIFEFASRLALTHEQVFDERVHIKILLSDLKGRHLFLSSSRWMPLPDRYDIADSAIPFTSEYSKEDIIANPRELALQYAMKLFQRFKWNSSKEFLQDIQSRIGRFF